MKLNHVAVVKGEAFIKGRSSSGIEVTCNGESYMGRNLLVCTGSESAVPPIPGLREAGDTVLTNREILELTERPESLVVIGGGGYRYGVRQFLQQPGYKSYRYRDAS